MSNIILSIIFLPILFLIDGIASFEDIRSGKIRNKWIVLGVVWGLIIFSLFFIWRFIARPASLFFHYNILHLPDSVPVVVYTLNLSFIAETMLNLLVSAVVAFLMWKFSAWAAGDAKLFIVNAFLLPLTFYEAAYFPVFPSLVLLVNIFSVFLLFLFFNAIYFFAKSLWQQIASGQGIIFLARQKSQKVFGGLWLKIKDKKFWLEGLKMLMVPLAIILFFVFLQPPASKYLNIDAMLLQAFLFAGLIIFYKSWSKFFSRKPIFRALLAIFILVFIYGIYSQGAAFLPIFYSSLKITVVFMVILLSFQWLIEVYIKRTQVRNIKISELLPGMLVDVSSLGQLKLERENNFSISGLSQEQVDEIKEKAAQVNLKELGVCRVCPFAVWIFAGAISTCFLGQPIFNLLIKLSQ
ncbi:MAG TPA: hypothetical protein P5089_01705 [Candidatus Portnoybacteria bacterium]|nr:hypothetical protein [Candidatus Portnoybacteria bacterium]